MDHLSSGNGGPFDDFTAKDFEDLWKRLRNHTHFHYWWLPSRIGDGVDLDDLAAQAICDTLSNKREKPPGVNLVTFLINVIKSKVSHLLEKEARLQARGNLSEHLAPAGAHGETQGLPPPGDDQPQNDDALLVKIRELVGDDGLLMGIVELWYHTPDLKPKQIAETLGIPMQEMRNAQKRLRRRLEDLR